MVSAPPGRATRSVCVVRNSILKLIDVVVLVVVAHSMMQQMLPSGR